MSQSVRKARTQVDGPARSVTNALFGMIGVMELLKLIHTAPYLSIVNAQSLAYPRVGLLAQSACVIPLDGNHIESQLDESCDREDPKDWGDDANEE